MKSTIINIIGLLGLLLTVAGCTTNNGPDDTIYGTWKMTAMTVDGEPDPAYGNDILWVFQNNIVEMVQVNDTEHSADPRWGTWSIADGRFLFDFTHTDDRYPDANGYDIYRPLPQTHMPQAQFVAPIAKKTSGQIIFTYTPQSGPTYTYYLKKWG